jgi:uncharacterized membrane protein
MRDVPPSQTEQMFSRMRELAQRPRVAVLAPATIAAAKTPKERTNTIEVPVVPKRPALPVFAGATALGAAGAGAGAVAVAVAFDGAGVGGVWAAAEETIMLVSIRAATAVNPIIANLRII